MGTVNEHFPGRHYHAVQDGRIQCDVCPRFCTLADGQRGMCFVRRREGQQIVLTTYGRSSGFVIDPIEKKPLNHFHPGSSVLSFGTAGCNLACKFCQNWDISKSSQWDTLQSQATPDALAAACVRHGCRSIAFTYNDPVIFLEYAVDTARACRERGIETVAVTAGYVTPEAREDLYSVMTAANVDLKGFTETFYHKVTASHLAPVLDTLKYLKNETAIWFELTTLLIPGLNDGEDELARASDWILENLGEQVPLHFTAFHPDYKMTDIPATPPATLRRARQIARAAGLRHVYTGNVHDPEGGSTYCPGCGRAVITRDWYEIVAYEVEAGRCRHCGVAIAGHFGASAGAWGRRRLRVVIDA